MNIPRVSRSALIALLSLPAFSASQAQEAAATTDPVGFTTITVRAKINDNRALTMVVLPMERAAAYNGACNGATFSVNGSGQSVITFSSNVFTADQFTGVGNQHYFRLKNGDNAGDFSTVIANTENSLTLADDFNSVLLQGTSFSIVPYWTLGTALPNGAGLNGGNTQGGPTSSTDNVILYNTNFTPTTYYWKLNASPPSWAVGNTPANNAIIPPGTGFVVDRRTNATASIVLPGTVPLGTSAVAVNGSPTASAARPTLVGSAYPLASKTLSELGLYTGNSSTGLQAASNAGAADNLTIYNPTTGSQTVYYYHSGNNRWQTGNTPAGDVTIPEGSAVLITRKGGRPGFTWYIPQPAMSVN